MPQDIIKNFPFDEKNVMKEVNVIGIMEKRNVTTAFPGTKKVNGRDTGEPCVVVGVHDKMHKSLLRKDDLVPEKLPSGVKTDVIIMERIIPLTRTSPVTPPNFVDPYYWWERSVYYGNYQYQIANDDPNCAGANMYPSGGGSSPWDYGCPLHAWKHRPLVGGISIGTYWYDYYDVVLGDVWDERSNGTLCAMVRDKIDGKIALLSNNHVFARNLVYYDVNYSVPSGGEQSVTSGTYVTQPGWIDYNYWYRISEQTYETLGYEPSGAWTPAERAVRDAFFQEIICGEVKRVVPIQFGTDSDQNNTVDCGIASINQSLAYHGIFKAHVGPYPFATKDEYATGDSVYLSSRTTGYRSPDDTVSPYIQSVNAIINVQYASGDSGIAKFTDQIMIVSEEGNVSKGGDSGSPVLVYTGNIFKLAGIIFAGGITSYNFVYANHMENVADQLQIEAWDGSIRVNNHSYGINFGDTCYHKIGTIKKEVTHTPEYLYGNCQECESPITFSFADEYGAEVINSIWKIPVKGETTIEKAVYLWFDKGDPQDRTPKDDCSDGQYKITNVRITVANMDESFSGGTNQQGQECVDEKWISLRSDGIRTHYCDEMIDDNQSTFKAVGGGFTNASDYLAVGDFCPDSARRIFIKVTVPEGVESEGAVFPKLMVQYNVENESSSSESQSSSSVSSVSSISSSSLSSSSYSSYSSSSLSSLSSSSSSISSSESSSSESSLSSSSESSLSSSLSSSSSSSESSESSSESSESSSSSSSAESKSSTSSTSSTSSLSSSSESSLSSSLSSLSSSSSNSSSSSSSSSLATQQGTFYPAASEDDAQCTVGGVNFNNTAWNPILGNVSGTAYRSIIRFNNITIPNSANIVSAFVRFTAYAAYAVDTMNIDIQGQDEDNPSAPSDASGITGASLTTSKVDWDGEEAWSDGGTYDTPDISSVIQEIVNQGYWASGEAMIIHFIDDGSSSNATRRFSAYDYSGASEIAELHVEWTT